MSWDAVCDAQIPFSYRRLWYRHRPRKRGEHRQKIAGEDFPITTRCDEIIHVPLRNNTDSLKVAVAAGIILHALLIYRNLLPHQYKPR